MEMHKLAQTVEDWVRNLQSKEAGGNDEEHDRRFTVRVDLGCYVMIDQLSARFGMSKTRCAQELLQKAASEAYELAGFSDEHYREGIEAEL